MTTFQRLRALVREWRRADKTLPPEIAGPVRSGMLFAAYCCADDLQEVLDEIREQKAEAGKKGGKSTSPAKVKAVRRNGRLSGSKKEPG